MRFSVGENTRNINGVSPTGHSNVRPPGRMSGEPGTVNAQGHYVPTRGDLGRGESKAHGKGNRHRGYSTSY